jgi:hypothetical protein
LADASVAYAPPTQRLEGGAVGAEVELWTREGGSLAALLPRASEWEGDADHYEFEGEAWLVSVSDPEPVEPGEVPPELAGLVDDLRYRVDVSVEPGAPDPEAWTLVSELLESVGRALGGAAVDPDSGHARTWGS